ncbi:MAG: ABC transporter substrate-binding protein [Synergistaceae bacterium]|jgi:taurine transport system substrate-binding protein|nr:ABC transporter substrate-binding protein [Synergistaceae bacterium]
MKIRSLKTITALILTLVVSKTAFAATPPKIVIGYQNIPNGEIIAKTKGWYESELGAPVEFKQFDSGRDVNTAFVSGSVDFGLLGTAPAAVGISAGVPYEVFWIHDVIGAAESLVVKNSSGVKDISGLVGKKIAAPFASTAHYSLLAAIELAGVDASTISIIDLQPPDILAAWKRGDIDGAYVWHPTLASLLEDGTVITDSALLAGKGVLTADVGVVRRDFARDYPEVAARYVAIQKKAIELYRSDPNAAAEAIVSQFGITPREALEQARQLIWLLPSEQAVPQYLGTPGAPGKLAETLKSTADFLVTQGSIEKAASVEDFKKAVNPAFLTASPK